MLIIAIFNYYVLCVRYCARCEGYSDERDRHKHSPLTQGVYSSLGVWVLIYS